MEVLLAQIINILIIQYLKYFISIIIKNQDQQMRRGNIFNIDPYRDNALSFIVNQVSKMLIATQQAKLLQIQIQVKFAEFKYFSQPSYPEINQSSQKMRQINGLLNCVQSQRFYFKDSLKKLSFQNIILLNQLGRKVYMLYSGFDDHRYKKFYFIRQFLVKICQFNRQMKANNIHFPQHPKNIYHQFSEFADNRSFQLVQEDELRLDLYVNAQGPTQLCGRYTYSPKTGWTKTKKTSLLKQQIDLMLSQKTFRLAANIEQQTSVAYQDLCSLKQLFTKKPKCLEVRLKKSLRVVKSNRIQYSLSEVYQSKQRFLQNFSDLQGVILQDAIILDDYLSSKFQIFYLSQSMDEAKFQIQAQFTKNGIMELKEYADKNQLKQIHYQIQDAINSLYNLIWSDHSVKTKQAVWMDKLLNYCSKSNESISYPRARLLNQFGSYMHNILHQEMTQLKDQQ